MAAALAVGLEFAPGRPGGYPFNRSVHIFWVRWEHPVLLSFVAIGSLDGLWCLGDTAFGWL